MSRISRTSRKCLSKQIKHDLLQSCRLCGIIGGSRMPIIQETIMIGDDTSIDESTEVQINKKIKDCLSIEVKHGDKLPPLICVICLNKVNDFYEFRCMCAETNIRLHKILGLSVDKPQPVGMIVSTGSSDNKPDCILGVEGPVFFQSPHINTASRITNSRKFKSIKRETKAVKCETSRPGHDTIVKSEAVTIEPFMPILKIKSPNKRERDRERKIAKQEKKTVLQSSLKHGSDILITAELDISQKNNDMQDLSLSTIKSMKKKKWPLNCQICSCGFATNGALQIHMIAFHSPRILQFGCAPCGEGFHSKDDFRDHHRWHKFNSVHYDCLKCLGTFKTYRIYSGHLDRGECIPEYEVEDYICHKCNSKYETKNTFLAHDCKAIKLDCQFCGKTFLKPRLVNSHEKHCQYSFANNLLHETQELEYCNSPNNDNDPDYCLPKKVSKKYVQLKEIHKKVKKSEMIPNITIKTEPQEYGIDIHYEQMPSNLDIKIEQDDHHSCTDTIKKEHGTVCEIGNAVSKPHLKLKIKKEHGTLNSIIIEDDIESSSSHNLNQTKRHFNNNTSIDHNPPLTIAHVKTIQQEEFDQSLFANRPQGYMCEIATRSLQADTTYLNVSSNEVSSISPVNIKLEPLDPETMPSATKSLHEFLPNEESSYLAESLDSTTHIDPAAFYIKAEIFAEDPESDIISSNSQPISAYHDSVSSGINNRTQFNTLAAQSTVSTEKPVSSEYHIKIEPLSEEMVPQVSNTDFSINNSVSSECETNNSNGLNVLEEISISLTEMPILSKYQVKIEPTSDEIVPPMEISNTNFWRNDSVFSGINNSRFSTLEAPSASLTEKLALSKYQVKVESTSDEVIPPMDVSVSRLNTLEAQPASLAETLALSEYQIKIEPASDETIPLVDISSTEFLINDSVSSEHEVNNSRLNTLEAPPVSLTETFSLSEYQIKVEPTSDEIDPPVNISNINFLINNPVSSESEIINSRLNTLEKLSTSLTDTPDSSKYHVKDESNEMVPHVEFSDTNLSIASSNSMEFEKSTQINSFMSPDESIIQIKSKLEFDTITEKGIFNSESEKENLRMSNEENLPEFDVSLLNGANNFPAQIKVEPPLAQIDSTTESALSDANTFQTFDLYKGTSSTPDVISFLTDTRITNKTFIDEIMLPSNKTNAEESDMNEELIRDFYSSPNTNSTHGFKENNIGFDCDSLSEIARINQQKSIDAKVDFTENNIDFDPDSLLNVTNVNQKESNIDKTMLDNLDLTDKGFSCQVFINLDEESVENLNETITVDQYPFQEQIQDLEISEESDIQNAKVQSSENNYSNMLKKSDLSINMDSLASVVLEDHEKEENDSNLIKMDIEDHTASASLDYMNPDAKVLIGENSGLLMNTDVAEKMLHEESFETFDINVDIEKDMVQQNGKNSSDSSSSSSDTKLSIPNVEQIEHIENEPRILNDSISTSTSISNILNSDTICNTKAGISVTENNSTLSEIPSLTIQNDIKFEYDSSKHEDKPQTCLSSIELESINNISLYIKSNDDDNRLENIEMKQNLKGEVTGHKTNENVNGEVNSLLSSISANADEMSNPIDPKTTESIPSDVAVELTAIENEDSSVENQDKIATCTAIPTSTIQNLQIKNTLIENSVDVSLDRKEPIKYNDIGFDNMLFDKCLISSEVQTIHEKNDDKVCDSEKPTSSEFLLEENTDIHQPTATVP